MHLPGETPAKLLLILMVQSCTLAPAGQQVMQSRGLAGRHQPMQRSVTCLPGLEPSFCSHIMSEAACPNLEAEVTLA